MKRLPEAATHGVFGVQSTRLYSTAQFFFQVFHFSLRLERQFGEPFELIVDGRLQSSVGCSAVWKWGLGGLE